MTVDPRRLISKTLGLGTAKNYVCERLLPGWVRRRRFTAAYATNYWRGDESRSGAGSSIVNTEVLRAALPSICRDLSVRSLLDVPCGDFNWMQHVDLTGVEYIGADIVPILISSNIERFGNSKRTFVVLDLVATVPPKVDLVFCRDLLVHLPFREVARALCNIRSSGANWLLTTTFWNHQYNEDLGKQDWRPLNLERPPFRLPQPQSRILENCTQDEGRYEDKSLGLWPIGDLL